MGSSQSAIITKFTSTRAVDVAEGLKLLKKQSSMPAAFSDPRFFKYVDHIRSFHTPDLRIRAVLPPLAAILAPENTNVDTKISALHDLSFLVVRPPSTSTEMVNFCLGNPVESLLVSPMILSLFSPDTDVRTAATEAVAGLAPSGGLFGASEFGSVLVDYLRNVGDEVAKVRLLPSLWMSGTHLGTVLKPMYATVLHILLNSERNSHLRAQIIAEFRRILHEEPTVLTAHTATLLFNTLRDIISNHNASEVDVVVDFSYGCLMKLIPQRRSVLGPALLKTVIDLCASTLSQRSIAPQYLDVNCNLTTSVIECCDESSSASISYICVSVSRHYSNLVHARGLDDAALTRLATSVLQCFSSVVAWPLLPLFPLWSPKFYQSVSTVVLVSVLSGLDPIATLSANLLSRVAHASNSYLQFFIGDFSLAFLIHVARLLHPTRLSAPKMKSSAEIRAVDSDMQLPCAAILEELYSLPTTAERLHRKTKEDLVPELMFLAEYPVSAVSAPSPDDQTSFGVIQRDLWTALNLVRAALCHIMLCLIRVRGRTQQQLIELFSIWYDRMSFSGHFILVDVLNKALMSLLVKADGGSLVSASLASSGTNSPSNTMSLRGIAPLVGSISAATSSSQPSDYAMLTSSSSSSLASPSASSLRTSLTNLNAIATAPPAASPSNAAPTSQLNTSLPSLPSPPSSPIPNFPIAPGSPLPHTMALTAESDRIEMQKKMTQMEHEMQALMAERTQLNSRLSEKDKNFTDVVNEKEQLLSQLACAVCLENILANKPVCLGCGHLFCGSCVDSFMKNQAKCPLCKSDIKEIVKVKGLES